MATPGSSSSKGLSVAIVHFGEDIPGDDGYVPLRYGRLAQQLTADGADVVRISPNFSHFRRTHRPVRDSHSDEGRHHLVPASGYKGSYDLSRIRFFADLVRGAASYLRAHRSSLDVVLFGVPPPGAASAFRRAVGNDVRLVGDVRDLWPEAFAVGRKWAMPPARGIGKMLSQELRLADAVTAVTPPMLDWASSFRGQRLCVPIGLQPLRLDAARLPSPCSALQVCFLSNHSHGYDFGPVLDAWETYCHRFDLDDGKPLLTFVGCEPADASQRSRAQAMESVEFLGRVAPDEVAAILNGADVGIAPSTKEWETSLGNKIFDYLAAGLYCVHSIDRSATLEIDVNGLGEHCERSESAWGEVFGRLHEDLGQTRAERQHRIATADRLFGRPVTTEAFLSALTGTKVYEPSGL